MASALEGAVVDGAPPRAAERGRGRARRLRLISVIAAVTLAVTLLTVLLVDTVGGGSAPTAYTVKQFSVPTAYHVTYAVTAAGAPSTTEQLWVQRPLESVDMTLGGAPPGGPAYLTMVNRLGTQVLKAGNAAAGELRVPAMSAPQDVRPDVIVPAGLRSGRLTIAGSQVVLGRRCETVRSAAPLRSGFLRTLASRSTYTDTCIDASGIVLRETTVQRGKVVSDKRAVAVVVGAAAVRSATFDLAGTPTAFNAGGGAFSALTLTSRPPGGSWALMSPPPGFRQVGRFAVVPAQPQAFGQIDAGAASNPTGLPSGLVTELDDVFVRGADVIVLQQGSTLNGATFAPPPDAQAVDLGDGLGTGQLLLGATTATIAAEPYGGKRFVRLSGTLPPDQLIALARSLARQPAGTLTRLPGGSR